MTNGEDLKVRAQKLASALPVEIIGQDHATSEVADLVLNWTGGLTSREKPLSFLLLGSTGIGKSETAKLVSRTMFGVEPLCFDMSEFQHPDSIGIFLGRNTDDGGRLGLDLDGQLPAVVNFDEIEKCYPRVLDVTLQILDEGRVTASNGKKYRFNGSVVVMTSNIGGAEIASMRSTDAAGMRNTALNELKSRIGRDEFEERFDAVLIYKPLEEDSQRRIFALMWKQLTAEWESKGYKVTIDEKVIEFLLRKGVKRDVGVRRLRRTIVRYVENALRPYVYAGKSFSGRLTVNAARNGFELI